MMDADGFVDFSQVVAEAERREHCDTDIEPPEDDD